MTALLAHRWFKCIAAVVVVTMTVLTLGRSAQAGFLPTHETLPGSLRAADLASVGQALEHKLVVERLGAMGYSRAEVSERLAQLSDAELRTLAADIDTVTYGGDAAIGIVIGVLVIAILVIVILKLTDKRIVID